MFECVRNMIAASNTYFTKCATFANEADYITKNYISTSEMFRLKVADLNGRMTDAYNAFDQAVTGMMASMEVVANNVRAEEGRAAAACMDDFNLLTVAELTAEDLNAMIARNPKNPILYRSIKQYADARDINIVVKTASRADELMENRERIAAYARSYVPRYTLTSIVNHADNANMWHVICASDAFKKLGE